MPMEEGTAWMVRGRGGVVGEGVGRLPEKEVDFKEGE